MDGAEISPIIQKARYALWAPCSVHPPHQLFLFIILLIGLGILLAVPSHGGMTTFASPKSRPSPCSVPQLFVQENEVPMLFWMLMRHAPRSAGTISPGAWPAAIPVHGRGIC